MIKNHLQKVKDFNEAFGIKNVPHCLRYKMLQEELNEFRDSELESFANQNTYIDKVERADAIVDIYYLLLGAIIESNLEDKFSDLFDEVHNSNMSKLDNGKPIYREDGKVLKGKNYFKPNIKAILNK